MFYRRFGYWGRCQRCPDFHYDKYDLEDECSHVNNHHEETENCACGFEEDNQGFPEFPMYAQSYVPVQTMNEVFKPEIGLKKGTIFPELVSPYCPGQSMEEIDYLKAMNKNGGCQD